MIQTDLDMVTNHIEDNRQRIKRQILFTRQAEEHLLEEFNYLVSIGDKKSFSYLVSKAVVFYCSERRKKRR